MFVQIDGLIRPKYHWFTTDFDQFSYLTILQSGELTHLIITLLQFHV